MAEILHEEHKGDTHWNVARLSGECDSWWDGVKSLQMKQNQLGVKLIRFHEDQQSVVFELDKAEIDALVAARQAFLEDIDSRKASDVARVNAEIEQACVLVQMVSRDHNLQWALLAEDGSPDENGHSRYSLKDGLADYQHEILIPAMRAQYVLKNVCAFLAQKKLIEPEKPIGDDFDPFIDSDDMP